MFCSQYLMARNIHTGWDNTLRLTVCIISGNSCWRCYFCCCFCGATVWLHVQRKRCSGVFNVMPMKHIKIVFLFSSFVIALLYACRHCRPPRCRSSSMQFLFQATLYGRLVAISGNQMIWIAQVDKHLYQMTFKTSMELAIIIWTMYFMRFASFAITFFFFSFTIFIILFICHL